MDNNWLMQALQSPEGMNFLDMWRQKSAIGLSGGTETPTVHRTPIAFTGNPSGTTSQLPTGGASIGRVGAQPNVLPLTQMQQAPVGGLGGGFSGGNDMLGRQAASNPMTMPYWNPGN